MLCPRSVREHVPHTRRCTIGRRMRMSHAPLCGRGRALPGTVGAHPLQRRTPHCAELLGARHSAPVGSAIPCRRCWTELHLLGQFEGPLPMQTDRTRLVHRLAAQWDGARAQPLFHRVALAELWHERTGGHSAAASHTPHLQAALDWLARSQDATPDDGFSRGYSLTWNPYLNQRGWQPAYPETTGYLIPTLYEAARFFGRPDLAARATRAARWEIDIQLSSGAVQGGVVGQPISPAVFNTGQVIIGWLAAFAETGDDAFASAASRAAHFLTQALDGDGHWRSGNSRFARSDATLYNARTAWALAEAGARLG